MTLFQLEASAQAPCTSTITGLADCPPPAAAVPAGGSAGRRGSGRGGPAGHDRQQDGGQDGRKERGQADAPRRATE
jgi:hypothetical protein